MHIIFFFQAEDGIRDVAVTGVQTCALPICLFDLLRLAIAPAARSDAVAIWCNRGLGHYHVDPRAYLRRHKRDNSRFTGVRCRSEEHTSELQSRLHLVCRLLLEKKKTKQIRR